jgi:hypothetical protein
MTNTDVAEMDYAAVQQYMDTIAKHIRVDIDTIIMDELIFLKKGDQLFHEVHGLVEVVSSHFDGVLCTTIDGTTISVPRNSLTQPTPVKIVEWKKRHAAK